MEIGNIYNVGAFEKFLLSGGKAGFTDSIAGVNLARNLTQVDPTMLELQYPDLTFVSSGITADNTGGFARRVQTLRKRALGSFRNAGDDDANKGKISLAREDSFLHVVVREAESDWSEDDVKEAELDNTNLVSDFVGGHQEVYQTELDLIGYVGIPDVAVSEGLLNHTAFTSGPAGGLISTLTPQQMYDAYADLITDQHNGVNNTAAYMAVRVDTPVRALNTLGVTMLNTAAGSFTVLTALKTNFPGVTFNGTFRADTVANGGDMPTNSATVAYSNSVQSMKFRIPVPLTVGEIIKTRSFKFEMDSKYRIAGLDLFEASAGRILTGL